MSINLFGKEVPLYGLLFIIGIVLAGLVALTIIKKRNIDSFDFIYGGVMTMLGAGLGAKLLFLAVSWKDIIKYNVPLEDVIKGGFVFYGGLIGGLITLLVFTRIYKLSTVDFVDVLAVVLPFGHAFGRVGCFFAGCCYGIPYDGPFSYVYKTTAGNTPLGVPLFPVQLLEALLLVLLFVGLYITFKCKPQRKFLTTEIYVIAYSIIRFALEFLRGDKERGGFLMLSTSQWISILLVVGLIAVEIARYVIGKKKIEKN